MRDERSSDQAQCNRSLSTLSGSCHPDRVQQGGRGRRRGSAARLYRNPKGKRQREREREREERSDLHLHMPSFVRLLVTFSNFTSCCFSCYSYCVLLYVCMYVLLVRIVHAFYSIVNSEKKTHLTSSKFKPNLT